MLDDARLMCDAGVVPREYGENVREDIADAGREPGLIIVERSAGVVARESKTGVEPSASAPDQRNPSKRPDVRISHSELLMLDNVTSRSWVCGFLMRYKALSASRGAC